MRAARAATVHVALDAEHPERRELPIISDLAAEHRTIRVVAADRLGAEVRQRIRAERAHRGIGVRPPPAAVGADVQAGPALYRSRQRRCLVCRVSQVGGICLSQAGDGGRTRNDGNEKLLHIQSPM